jgi:hypothetical protein
MLKCFFVNENTIFFLLKILNLIINEIRIYKPDKSYCPGGQTFGLSDIILVKSYVLTVKYHPN